MTTQRYGWLLLSIAVYGAALLMPGMSFPGSKGLVWNGWECLVKAPTVFFYVLPLVPWLANLWILGLWICAGFGVRVPRELAWGAPVYGTVSMLLVLPFGQAYGVELAVMPWIASMAAVAYATQLGIKRSKQIGAARDDR